MAALVAIVVCVATVAACGSSPAPTSRSSPLPAATADLTPVPNPAGPAASAAPTLPATTIVEGFGAIWDALPASWPVLPGQSQSEVGSDGSERLVVKGDSRALARQLAGALEERGWTVDIGSPLEDGTVVLDAVGPTEGCRVEARFSPPSPGDDIGTLLVYYGARCPFT